MAVITRRCTTDRAEPRANSRTMSRTMSPSHDEEPRDHGAEGRRARRRQPRTRCYGRRLVDALIVLDQRRTASSREATLPRGQLSAWWLAARDRVSDASSVRDNTRRGPLQPSPVRTAHAAGPQRSSGIVPRLLQDVHSARGRAPLDVLGAVGLRSVGRGGAAAAMSVARSQDSTAVGRTPYHQGGGNARRGHGDQEDSLGESNEGTVSR